MTREQLRTSQLETRIRARMAFVPVQVAGYFHTTDRAVYKRNDDGAIRRLTPKAKGKSARRADKEARRKIG